MQNDDFKYVVGKKRKLFLFTCMMFLVSSISEGQNYNSLYRKHELWFGFFSGVNRGTIHYSNARYVNINSYRFVGGINFEYMNVSNFSSQSRIALWGKGGKLEVNGSNYKFSPQYIDIDFIELYNFYISKSITPFVGLGVSCGFAVSGDIELYPDKIPITKYNVNPFNIGVKPEIGIKTYLNFYDQSICIIPSLGYDVGLSNTYSKHELKGESIPVNLESYHIVGRRTLSGIYSIISIMIRLDNATNKKSNNTSLDLPFYKSNFIRMNR